MPTFGNPNEAASLDQGPQAIIHQQYSQPGFLAKFRMLRYIRRYSSKITKLLNSVSCEDRDIQAMYQYAIAGGQRSRPLLVILACEAVGGTAETALPVAAAIELAHKASCIHDDLVDGDGYRRGRATFPSCYGAEKALAVGDLLISLSFEMLKKLTAPAEIALYCNHLFSETFRVMATGQLKDLIYGSNRSVDFEDSLQMLNEKTAAMGELALRIGAFLGGGDEDEVSALATYGKKMGLAFQLMNDLNNFYGSEQSVGRTPRTDLIAHRKTPLVCLALQIATSPDKKRLGYLMNMNGNADLEEVAEMRTLIQTSGAPNHVSLLVDSLLAEAFACLEKLQPSLPKEILGILTNRAFISKIYF